MPNDLLSTGKLSDAIRAKPVIVIWLLFALYALIVYGWRFEWAVETYLRFGVPIDVDGDFVNNWVVAKLTTAGQHALAYDVDRFNEQVAAYFGESRQARNWSYPPHFMLFLWPLGFLGYGSALAVYLGLTFLLFVSALLILRRRLEPQAKLWPTSLALLCYVLMMISVMQNGFLTGAATLFVLAFMKERPIIAGVALAFLTIKPQLGFLFPLLALMDRNWTLLRWATVFTVTLIGLSIALLGLDVWQAYITKALPYQRFVMTEWYGAFIKMMPSTFGSLRSLHVTPRLALLGQLPIAIFALGALVWLLRRLADPMQRAFVLLTATFLVTPYCFNYDLGALSVVAAFIAQRESLRAHRGAAIIIALVSVLPGMTTALGRAGLPISPLILIAGLFAIATLVPRGNSAARQLAAA